jgi:hypothetical protein
MGEVFTALEVCHFLVQIPCTAHTEYEEIIERMANCRFIEYHQICTVCTDHKCIEAEAIFTVRRNDRDDRIIQ